MCSVNSQLLEAATDGLIHLQRMVHDGTLYVQHNDIDATFVRQFVDIYMPKNEHGLANLQQLIQEYSDLIPLSSSETTVSVHAVSDAQYQLGEDILLSFYIGLLLRIVQSLNVTIIESATIRQFLHHHQSRLFYNTDLVTHPPLFQLTYELLFELDKQQIRSDQWPFQLDLHRVIIAPLQSECTSIAFRQAVEQFAIAQIGRQHHGTFQKNILLIKQQYKQDSIINELVTSVVQVLLDADFSIVLESCARILYACLYIATTLPRILNEKIIQKAKRTKRIGHAFADLTAKLLSFYSNFELTIAEGFTDRITHTLILSKLAVLEQEEIKTTISVKNKNERRRYVLDLFANVSQFDLNQIGPLLSIYRKAMEIEEFNKFFLKLLSGGKWQNCSKDALNSYVQCLLLIDPKMNFIVPDVISLIQPCLFTNPSAVSMLEIIIHQTGGDYLLQLHPELAKQMSKQITPYLIQENTRLSLPIAATATQVQKGLDNYNDDEFVDFDWESMDTVLRILDVCGPHHSLDNAKLFERLMIIALRQYEYNSCSQFLCQSAIRLLCRLFPQQIYSKWSKLFKANAEDEEIRFMLLSNALLRLEHAGSENTANFELFLHVVDLMELVDPDEEESPSILCTSIQLCERLIGGDTELSAEVSNQFVAIHTRLKVQLDMVKQRNRNKNYEQMDVRMQMEELIKEFASHRCNALGSDGKTNVAVNQCGSKDCY